MSFEIALKSLTPEVINLRICASFFSYASSIVSQTCHVAYRIPLSNITYRVSHIPYPISHIAFRVSHIAFCISHIAYRIAHSAYRMSHVACRVRSSRGS